MYRWKKNCVFSTLVGAARATVRSPRWLSGSVSRLITPPLPAASRPSKMISTLRPFSLIQACHLTSSFWRRLSSESEEKDGVSGWIALLGWGRPARRPGRHHPGPGPKLRGVGVGGGASRRPAHAGEGDRPAMERAGLGSASACLSITRVPTHHPESAWSCRPSRSLGDLTSPNLEVWADSSESPPRAGGCFG